MLGLSDWMFQVTFEPILNSVYRSDETHFEYVLSAQGVSQAPSLAGASSLTTGASPPADGPEELQSLISHVKDLLPHLGDGFIEVGDVANRD